MREPRASRVAGVIAGMVLAAGMICGARPASSQGIPGDPMAGKTVYELHCQRCHGPGGWGDGPEGRTLRVPPANFHGPVIQMKSDEQLQTVVEFGVVLSPMHAFRGRLSDRDIADVVAYVRLLAQRGR